MARFVPESVLSSLYAKKSGEPLSGQPLNLNLARIVHRLLTTPHGWRVEHLQDELDVAPRTYRKYRQILREQFIPFQRRDGTSMLTEVGEGAERYLRLRPPREFGPSSPDLEVHAAAVHFCHAILNSTGNPALMRAAQTLLEDFRQSLRHRDFLMRGLLADADRMFLAETTVEFPHLAEAAHAIVNRRRASFEFNGTHMVANPLSIALRPDGAVLIVQTDEDVVELDAAHIQSFETLAASFEYPTPAKYPPR